MSKSLRDLLDFAVETAFEAGKLTLGYFQAGVQADYKEDDSPVTIADRKAEALIRARIEKKFPGHEIVGEEFDDKKVQAATHRWFIDPIDGTKSFIRGVPIYAVLLGLEIEGTVEAGVVYFPGLNEIICAATGEGCYWNGRRAYVSKEKDLSRSVVAYTDSLNFEKAGKGDAWRRIQRACYYRAGWCDAYGHALVATGRIELMLDPLMNPYDCGPFPVILREAGGFFGDWSGNETIFANEALSTPKQLLPEVLRVIQANE